MYEEALGMKIGFSGEMKDRAHSSMLRYLFLCSTQAYLRTNTSSFAFTPQWAIEEAARIMACTTFYTTILNVQHII